MAASSSTAAMSRNCRCISGRGLASVICRRKPRFFAASPWKTISARCSKSWSPTRSGGRATPRRFLYSLKFHARRRRRGLGCWGAAGGRRRCEIARALGTRPNYMLLDEPFAGIDPIAVGDIQSLVRHLTNRGIGVLITDHNVRETLGLTDRAYIIYSGEVLMEGRADDIVNNPEVRRLYLGEEFRL